MNKTGQMTRRFFLLFKQGLAFHLCLLDEDAPPLKKILK